MAEKIPIVIADDHAVLRESLTALLDTQPDLEVVGKASNGVEALDLVQKHQPTVLVLDLFMPGGDGFEVLRTLDRANSRVAAVVLSHNHPSGVAEPSRADEALTQQLRSALALVDVRVLDHIVVSAQGAVSFAERGLL